MIYDPRSIQLSPQQQEEIAALAERTGQPWQELLAQALRRISTPGDQPFPRGESLYDVLAREGLIGCIESGVGDLSTNPKHMEGFGESDAD